MAELVGGALLGTAVSVLYESLKALIVKNLTYGSILEEIISRLDSLKPLIQQMTEVYSDEQLQGLVEVIQKGKALVGGYLVHGRNPKRKDVEKFDEWDDLLKRQLEMLNIQSLIDGRKTAVNTEAMVPLVRNIKTTAQNTEALVQELVNRSDTEKQNQSAENEAYCAVPELPPLTVGQDFPLEELKRKMLLKEENMLLIRCWHD